MNAQMIAAEAFKLAIFVAALVFVRWNLYEGYRMDAFRQRLFDLRKELFEYAADGGISFEHEAYELLRTRINRLIRYAHTYSLVHLFLALAFEHEDATPKTEIETAIEAIRDPRVRERLTWINTRVTVYFAWHLVCSSWIALSFGLTIYAVTRIGERAKELAESCILRLPGLRLLERHTYPACHA
jgi:hypothetical protein